MKKTRRQFIKEFIVGTGAFIAGSRSIAAATAKLPLRAADLDFLTLHVNLKRRREWTDHQPAPLMMREAGEYDRITVHHIGRVTNYHTVVNSVIHDLRGVLVSHAKRGYGDIGYHFIVDYAGRVWEGRSLAYEGAHVAHENERNIGVTFLGNFEHQKPSGAQLETLRKIVPLLTEHYGVKTGRIYGHRDLGSTVCPGKTLYPHVVRMRRAVVSEVP
ncbi:MAG: peptidoglycan recognition family protein [Kiritimatiellia bacterium]